MSVTRVSLILLEVQINRTNKKGCPDTLCTPVSNTEDPGNTSDEVPVLNHVSGCIPSVLYMFKSYVLPLINIVCNDNNGETEEVWENRGQLHEHMGSRDRREFQRRLCCERETII